MSKQLQRTIMIHANGRFASEQPADIKKVVTAMNYVSCVGLTLWTSPRFAGA